MLSTVNVTSDRKTAARSPGQYSSTVCTLLTTTPTLAGKAAGRPRRPVAIQIVKHSSLRRIKYPAGYAGDTVWQQWVRPMARRYFSFRLSPLRARRLPSWRTVRRAIRRAQFKPLHQLLVNFEHRFTPRRRSLVKNSLPAPVVDVKRYLAPPADNACCADALANFIGALAGTFPQRY